MVFFANAFVDERDGLLQNNVGNPLIEFRNMKHFLFAAQGTDLLFHGAEQPHLKNIFFNHPQQRVSCKAFFHQGVHLVINISQLVFYGVNPRNLLRVSFRGYPFIIVYG